ncbi:hypothetical protein LTR84_003026 [Exophiala bonariae]|uniref:methionyl-tRNA formyltransferase n=1 Tax=Exophiala bonariae TaxID=1690606 RepID=A0AAV9NAD6_9EURO|nr:hypothetical protein LTR84_003026 [Exophiala bonariae]
MKLIIPWSHIRRVVPRPRNFKPSLYQKQSRCWLSTNPEAKSSKPLRILFCGSDEFSATSLDALYAEFKSPDSHILSIDVVTLTDKLKGRNYREKYTPYIKQVAERHGLPLHRINTFDNWQPPVYNTSFNSEINLVIAVSFGLLIPMRIINGSEYGGLNVHPSMLPDLRGAAPIQWAILRGLSHTGVSVQTLHPTKFDHGIVLDQTPYPGVRIPDNIQPQDLTTTLATLGSQMLVRAIRNRLYVPPYVPVSTSVDQRELTKAPKISPQTGMVDFHTMTRAAILRLNRAIQPFKLIAEATPNGSIKPVRFKISEWLRSPTSHDIPLELQDELLLIPKGVPYTFIDRNTNIRECQAPLFINVTPDRLGGPSQLVITDITIPSKSQDAAAKTAAKAELFDEPIKFGPYLVYRFSHPLSEVAPKS